MKILYDSSNFDSWQQSSRARADFSAQSSGDFELFETFFSSFSTAVWWKTITKKFYLLLTYLLTLKFTIVHSFEIINAE